MADTGMETAFYTELNSDEFRGKNVIKTRNTSPSVRVFLSSKQTCCNAIRGVFLEYEVLNKGNCVARTTGIFKVHGKYVLGKGRKRYLFGLFTRHTKHFGSSDGPGQRSEFEMLIHVFDTIEGPPPFFGFTIAC